MFILCAAARVETYFYDKLEKWETTKRRDRETNCEALGQQMIDAGNSFGPGTAYGTVLVNRILDKNRINRRQLLEYGH